MNKFLMSAMFGSALLVAGCFGGNGTSQAGDVKSVDATKLEIPSYGQVRRSVDCEAGVVLYIASSYGIVAVPLNATNRDFTINNCGAKALYK